MKRDSKYYSSLRKKLLVAIVGERRDDYLGIGKVMELSAKDAEEAQKQMTTRIAIDTMCSLLIHLIMKHDEEYELSDDHPHV